LRLNKIKYLLVVFLLAFLLKPVEFFPQNNSGVVIQKKQQDPNRVREQLAMSYYRNKEFDKALVIYEELYDSSPKQYYYSYYLNCLIYLNEYKDADKLVKKQLKSQPGNIRLIIDQIYVYDLLENTRKSEKMMAELMDGLPLDKSQVVQIAGALEAKGYFDEALEVYNKATVAPGVNYNYNLEKARVYQYTGEYDKMFDAYLAHLDLQPQDMQTIKNRMQALMRQDVDDNLSAILKTKLLEKSQAEPENLVYSEMYLWHLMQTKDFEMAYRQARSIDLRFENHEIEMLDLANICYANKNYALAAKAFEYVKDKKEKTPFYLESYTGFYLSEVMLAGLNPETDTKKYRELKKSGEKALEELGVNRGTVPIVESLSHLMAFKLGEFDEAKQILESTIAIENLTPAEKSGLKLELADILLFQDEVWDATLLYSQIEGDMKNEPIGYEAKYRNATLFYYVGEYNWAATKLDVLKSATSKLISNNAIELSLFINEIFAEDTLGFTLKMFGKADLYAYRGYYDSALIWLEKIERQPGGINSYQYVVYKKAELMVEKHDYVQADSLYQYLAENYPESIKADNALFKRAEINRLYLGNEEKAKELYLVLMTDYPDSIYAGEGRKLYRMLREDEDVGL
jgi:tetratricopeptide (TPR) repeat protein